MELLRQQLKDHQFSDLVKPFKDRVRAPNISSLEQNPVAALGVVYGRIAKHDKQCADKGSESFEYKRLGFAKDDTCEGRTYPAKHLYLKHVEGGAAAELEWVIGKAAADAKYMFELSLSEPVGAAFEGKDCLDAKKLTRLTVPARTCEISYITGIILTEITYRTFKEFKGDANSAFGLVKVGGRAYGSESDLDTKFALTADIIDISGNFPTREGFLTKLDAIPTTAKKDPLGAESLMLLFEQGERDGGTM